MDVSENNGTPKSSILIGFSIITMHFGYPYFWKHPYSEFDKLWLVNLPPPNVPAQK